MGFIKSLFKEPLFRTKGATSRAVSPKDANSWIKISGNGFTHQTASPTTILKDFETIPDLFIITDYLASQIANIPTKLVKPSGKPSNNADLAKLVRQPNYYQNWNELIKTFFSYYELLGNGYMYGIVPDGMGILSELYSLPADKTQVVLLQDKKLPNWMNEIVGYEVETGGNRYQLQADTVLHKRYVTMRYNDGSWVYGISKYIPGDKINQELKSIYDAKVSIIDHRGAFGVLSNESQMPNPEASKAVQDKLKANLGVKGNQDKYIVTTEKLSWQQMSMNVQELQLIENAKYDFEKMCQLSGFDPVIFSTEGSTFANKEIATKDLYKRVIVPKVNDFYNDLNEWISPYFGGDKIEPDWANVDELGDDKNELMARLEKQINIGMITPFKANELFYGEGDQTKDNPPPDEYYIRTSLKSVIEPEQPKPVEPILQPIKEDEVKKLFKTNGNGS